MGLALLLKYFKFKKPPHHVKTGVNLTTHQLYPLELYLVKCYLDQACCAPDLEIVKSNYFTS